MRSAAILLICIVFMAQMFAFVCVFLNIFNHFSSLGISAKHGARGVDGVGVSVDPLIDRVVFFLLDAFRTSFVFTHAKCLPQIRHDAGLVFNVRTFTPTVTSPRIKTLTTGTVPEFADVIFNLQSSEIEGDSLLYRWNNSNKSIAFYGDDTWLKLFSKEIFFRHREVSSFYAVDFTEVDNAVTEPLVNFELNQEDWDVLILHYLGLDHIGHSKGPDGDLVCTKLLEMDLIFHKIHESIVSKDPKSLLVVMGDHGMSNEGSHGGSTDDELYTPIFFVSQIFRNAFRFGEKTDLVEISQVDIVTTLALLTGVQIPSSSLGLFPEPLMEVVPHTQKRFVLRQNYEHLLNLCGDCGPYEPFHEENLKHNYVELNRLQQILLGRHSTVNRIHLTLIVMMMITSTVPLVMASSTEELPAFHGVSFGPLASSLIISVLTCCLFLFTSFDILLAIFAFPVFVPVYFVLTWNLNFQNMDKDVLFSVPLLVCHTVVLFSSSFVEEEHFFWYLTSQLLISATIYFIQRSYIIRHGTREKFPYHLSLIIAAISIRFCKAFIYPGVKWTDEGLDYARHLRAHAQTWQTPLFVLASLCALAVLLWKSVEVVGLGIWRSLIAFAFVLNFGLIFSYKVVRGDLKWWFWLEMEDTISAFDAVAATPYAQGSLLLLAIVGIFLAVKLKRQHFVALFLPFFFQLGCLLLKCHLAVPLFMLLLVSQPLCYTLTIDAISQSPIWKNLLVIAFSRMAFFALENSNRLATLDVGAAYVGLTEHHPVLSGCLIFTATSVGPLFVYIGASAEKSRFVHLIAYQCMIFVICAICITLLANHLFVWSVFAPKLLYEVFWTLLVFLSCAVFG